MTAVFLIMSFFVICAGSCSKTSEKQKNLDGKWQSKIEKATDDSVTVKIDHMAHRKKSVTLV